MIKQLSHVLLSAAQADDLEATFKRHFKATEYKVKTIKRSNTSRLETMKAHIKVVSEESLLPRSEL